ncbi:hypothetical protein [Ferrimonas marina]|uniref:Uncharacterized protein n=1 Tax=Ferrimonas marina TaxID=299255 RepID=A0A1M5ULK7_9GAMM|nr:hypothetical protein [Ferrimonas marina]SHH63603.1 hypothetical protein SAMN02745129_2617 [Ferrimonas marina]
MFTLKKEIDTTELIKWCTAIFGAAVAFIVVSLNEIENDNNRLKLELALAKREALVNVATYRPQLRIHYTNQMDQNQKAISIRVFIESISNFPVYFHQLLITLYDKDGIELEVASYRVEGLSSFSGLISPGIPFQVSYKVHLTQPTARPPHYVGVTYYVDADELIAEIFKSYLSTFEDDNINNWAQTAEKKEFKYRERIYPWGDNPIWESFLSNPG